MAIPRPFTGRLAILAVGAALLAAFRASETRQAAQDGGAQTRLSADQASQETERLLARVFPEAAITSFVTEPHDVVRADGSEQARWEVRALNRRALVARAIWDARTGVLLMLPTGPSCHLRGDGLRRPSAEELSDAARAWMAAIGIVCASAVWAAGSRPAHVAKGQWRVRFRRADRAAYAILDHDGHLVHAASGEALPYRQRWLYGSRGGEAASD